jgi:hypothetical protein
VGRYFALGAVVEGAAVEAVVAGADVDVVSPRGLPVVAGATFCGVVVTAFDGCVVEGLSEESSSPHAVTVKNAATTSRVAATRVDFMTLLDDQ